MKEAGGEYLLVDHGRRISRDIIFWGSGKTETVESQGVCSINLDGKKEYGYTDYHGRRTEIKRAESCFISNEIFDF